MRRLLALARCALVLGPSALLAFPSVYPTGTTIYKPEKAWNGYTIHPNPDGAILIDMNGNVVKQWKGLDGGSGTGPYRILPGGFAMGSRGARGTPHQDAIELVQLDWEGRVTWKFDRYEELRDPGKEPLWAARQHHDYQRDGNPVGYYVPGMDPLVDRGNTLILAHQNLRNPKITDKLLVDDVICEVTWEGEIVWQWRFSDHFDELGFSEEAKNTLYRHPGWNERRGSGDWLHVNSLSTLGPNKWNDAGDARFRPDNIIWSARAANIIGITDRKSGEIVWRVGPDYTASPALRALGQIVGQHHPHLIPKGLPGEGNILVFDNGGGPAGYGAPNPISVTGERDAQRDYSRVIEFDPITLTIVWEYSAATVGYQVPQHGYRFYSSFISSAQRLPNGNTLITEGADGRIFEVTKERELVWEYVSPFFFTPSDPRFKPTQQIYRAYRVPYDWIPQRPKPVEKAVIPPENSSFWISP